MRYSNIQFFIIFLFAQIFIFSCGNSDDNTNPEFKPCSENIDKTIKSEVVWKKDLGTFYGIQYYEDYFITVKPGYIQEIYSMTTGNLMTKIERPLLTTGSLYDCQIEKDYYYGFFNGKILRYNIKTKEYTFVEFEGDENNLTIFEDEFYYFYDGAIWKGNFETSDRQLILSMKYNYHTISLRRDILVFRNPDAENHRYIAFISYGQPNNSLESFTNFNIYDIDEKSLKEQLSFKIENSVNELKINNNIIICDLDNMVISYNLFDKKFFFINSTYKYISNIYAFQKKNSQTGKLNPMIFMNNDFLSAYDFNSNNMLWSCDKIEASTVSSIDLLDQKGNFYTYLCFMIDNDFQYYLVDPATGTVKSIINVKNSEYNLKAYKNSGVINNEFVFIAIDQFIHKIKIWKE